MKLRMSILMGVLLSSTTIWAGNEVKVGLSAEVPTGRNYILRVDMDKLELLGQLGLDVTSDDDVSYSTFRIGGGTAFNLIKSQKLNQKLNTYAGGKLLVNINHASIGNSSDTETSVSLIPILSARYKLLTRLSVSYEFQYELTFGSFITGTRGQVYLTYWF